MGCCSRGPDIEQLKRKYKEAKRRSEADPSNERLAKKYKEAKRRYKAVPKPAPVRPWTEHSIKGVKLLFTIVATVLLSAGPNQLKAPLMGLLLILLIWGR
jgi:hypothetical protein